MNYLYSNTTRRSEDASPTLTPAAGAASTTRSPKQHGYEHDENHKKKTISPNQHQKESRKDHKHHQNNFVRSDEKKIVKKSCAVPDSQPIQFASKPTKERVVSSHYAADYHPTSSRPGAASIKSDSSPLKLAPPSQVSDDNHGAVSSNPAQYHPPASPGAFSERGIQEHDVDVGGERMTPHEIPPASNAAAASMYSHPVAVQGSLRGGLIEAELVPNDQRKQQISEDELRSIREAAMQEAQQNLLRNAVQANVIASSTETPRIKNKGEEEEEEPTTNNKRLICLLVAVLVALAVVIVVVVGVVVGVSGRSSGPNAPNVAASLGNNTSTKVDDGSTISSSNNNNTSNIDYPCGGDATTEDDVTPPNIASFKATPNAIVLSDGGSRQVTLTVHVTDDLSGIVNEDLSSDSGNEMAAWMMQVELHSPTGGASESIVSPLHIVSGSNTCEADLEATATIDDSFNVGNGSSWNAIVKIVDMAGNEITQEFLNVLTVILCSIQPRPILFGLEGGTDRFGAWTSLSKDGSVVAIGSQVSDYIQVHRFNNGQWFQLGDTFFGDESANALSDDGTTLAMASPYDNTIFTYFWDGSSWFLFDTITSFVSIGEAVELSADGTVLAASSPSANSYIGEVRVYTYSTSDGWTQKGRRLMGRGGMRDFGEKLALSEDGNTVAVGIPGTYNFDTLGFVEVFEFVEDDWVQKGQTLEGLGVGNLFGRDVSLSSDGQTLAVGEAQAGTYEHPESGIIHLYRYNVNDEEWVELGSKIFGDAGQEYFGRTLALSGDANILVVRGTRLLRFFHAEDDEYVEFGEEEASSDYWNAASISRDGSTAATGGSVFDISCSATND